MSSVAHVAIHATQFPENIRRDLLESLRARRINHKFHYDSVRQTQQWLALHQVYSPSRNDADCVATYDRALAGAAENILAHRVHLIGLGCGGGQKDARLLRSLKSRKKEISCTPCDVSVAMVLVARQAALAVVPDEQCFPLVCDLATADDLPAWFDKQIPPEAARLITFFGMIPNFEPSTILPRLASLVRSEDFLLFSANLAPGKNYAAGLKKILPQYDNAPTREWLRQFLLDLGVERGDGEMRFAIEHGPARSGLKKIVARFHFAKPRRIGVEGEAFEFRAGDDVQLFFSYRYTPALVRGALGGNGLTILDEWITKSGEEGVFLCRRS
jgi:uncharacterized SAM-dependent methyltransferase